MKDAEVLDRADPLRGLRDQFELPHGLIYLAGHSLGPVSKTAIARTARTVQNEWGHALVSAWNDHDWINAPLRVGTKIAPLIGAREGEVLVADSTSVNLFKILEAVLQRRPEKKIILVESGEFPTDMHIAQGIAKLARGRRVKLAKKGQLEAKIDGKTAVVVASHVHYREGHVRDMAGLTRTAREAGAEIIWDLSHSVGAIEVDLHAAEAELAVGCGYKYLNGGPGAPAFLYIAQRRQPELHNPISGWLGHAQPFAFVDAYEAAPDLTRFCTGTPPIIQIAALEAGVELMLEAPLAARIAKGRALSQLFLERVFEQKRPGLSLLSPEDPARRGGHVTLRHKDAYAIVRALAARGVVGDYRAPEAMRFAFAPLYLSFAEAAAAADALVDVVGTGVYCDHIHDAQRKVT